MGPGGACLPPRDDCAADCALSAGVRALLCAVVPFCASLSGECGGQSVCVRSLRPLLLLSPSSDGGGGTPPAGTPAKTPPKKAGTGSAAATVAKGKKGIEAVKKEATPAAAPKAAPAAAPAAAPTPEAVTSRERGGFVDSFVGFWGFKR